MSISMGGGQRILDWLAECGVSVPPHVRRVTIDLDRMRPARIYFDCFGDVDLFAHTLDLSGVEIVREADPADCVAETET